jgi:hypothetical protein
MWQSVKRFLWKWFVPAEAQARRANDSSEESQEVLTHEKIAHGHWVAYDENLLERARTQWQFGDWSGLTELKREILQHHPDRAKLALLAAAGYQQNGDMVEAREHVRLAQEWGAGKKLVSQILISGVHNSIGRACALAGQSQRSLKHFEGAIQTGTPGSGTYLISQARIGNQLLQLGMSGNDFALQLTGLAVSGSTIPLKSSFTVALEQANEKLDAQQAEMQVQFKQQADEISRMRKSLDSTLKKEINNATRQLEAFLDIQSFFKTGEHLPMMHGWPVSPDFARYLIKLLEENDYDLILEFGSGTSTILMAKALAKLQRERQGKPAGVQVAFEHLEKYYTQTEDYLKKEGLIEAVQLTLALLQPYQAPNGNTYSYYSCHEKLAELAARQGKTPVHILMVIDGPPGITGKHARYPCLPAVLTHFPNNRIDMLLDDYSRQDEQEIGELWKEDLKRNGFKIVSEKINMEKDALRISGYL